MRAVALCLLALAAPAHAESVASLFESPGPDALVVYVDRVALPRETGVAILKAWDADGRHALNGDAALRFARREKLDVGAAPERPKSLTVLSAQGRVDRLPPWIADLRAQQREAAAEAARFEREADAPGSTVRSMDRRVAPALEKAVEARRRAAELGALADELEIDLQEAHAEVEGG